MIYLSEEEVYTSYTEASDEADQWRIDYPQYERLMDNGLLDDLDENLPEVNDGSLAASLFKLSKRVIKKNLSGTAKTLDRDDLWLTELANIYWEKKILPNAKMKATPRRKWKDAVRKAAGYGSQPIINLFVERGSYTGSDFLVPYAQDVKLEAGKDSDLDSDVIFWDVYYSKLQLENMIEQAKQEMKSGANKPSKAGADYSDNPEQSDGSQPYNTWNVAALEEILSGKPEEQRPGNQTPKAEQTSGQKKTGYHFFIAFQRGVDAPFMMCHPGKKMCVRKWTNPDPTGDIPVHYLYCYQDFVNPYGIGIVKLAGGTQNVLDYMRQADILATQLGLRPPKQIKGDEDQVDEDSLVYAQDANWYVGTAAVERMELADGVYSQLPGRIQMYQTSLQKMIPTGDTTISGTDSGDPAMSKTPAGVKLAAANLSIDDEDFSENVDETYALVAKSMINVQFANMQGTDLLKLNQEEKDRLEKAGLQFPENSMELQIVWDNARAKFDFEINPDSDPDLDDQAALEGRLKAYELMQADPTIKGDLAADNKRINKGELLGDIFSALTKNDKILVDIDNEEAQRIQQEEQQKAAAEAQANAKPAVTPKSPSESITFKDVVGAGATDAAAAMLEQAGLPSSGMTAQTPAPGQVVGGQVQQPGDPNSQDGAADPQAVAAEHIKQVMELYHVDEHTAAAMLEAERQGYSPKEILDSLKRNGLNAGVSNGA